MCAGTAASPADDIRPLALKLGGAALWRVLALLFSACLELGAVPSCWTIGYVKWLHKKGERKDSGTDPRRDVERTKIFTPKVGKVEGKKGPPKE